MASNFTFISPSHISMSGIGALQHSCKVYSDFLEVIDVTSKNEFIFDEFIEARCCSDLVVYTNEVNLKFSRMFLLVTPLLCDNLTLEVDRCSPIR